MVPCNVTDVMVGWSLTSLFSTNTCISETSDVTVRNKLLCCNRALIVG